MSTDPRIVAFLKQQISQMIKQGNVEVSGSDQTIYFFTGGIGVDGHPDGDFVTMPASYVTCTIPNLKIPIDKAIAVGTSHIAVYKPFDGAKETILLMKK